MMKAFRFLVELTILLTGCILAGYSIGTLQHYIVFGVWRYGFGKDALELALLEGGITGALFAIPTGLVAYYVILRRRVNEKQIATILVGSLIGGCVVGLATPVGSALLTPALTLGISWWTRDRAASVPDRQTPPVP